MTALTVYLSNVATSTLATAAALASTTGGALAGDSSLIGTSTGYGELYGLGNAGAWAAAGSIGSPSGNGWLWDVTTLVGQTIAAGTWTPTLRVRVSSGTATIDYHVQYFKRSSGGTYTLIGNVNQTGVAMTTAYQTLTPGASLGSMAFATGDKLYMHVWPNITANSTGSGAAVLFITVTTSATQGDATGAQVTPGYAQSPIALTCSLAGVGHLTPASITLKAALSKTVAGVGHLTPALSAKAPLSKTVAGVGHLTPAAMTFKTALSKAIAGVGTLTGTMHVTFSGQLHGVGTLVGPLTLKTALTKTFVGMGTLSPVFSAKAPLSKTVAGAGTFTPAAFSRNVVLFKIFTGTGALTGAMRLAWASRINGTGTLAATLRLIPIASLGVTIRGRGSLIASLPRYLYVTINGRSNTIARPVMGGSGLVTQIDGVPLYVLAGTTQIQNAIAKRSTAQFVARTAAMVFFQYGQEVSIFNNGVLVFSGYLMQDSMTPPGYQSSLLHTVQAADQHYLADKRIVAAAFVNSTPGLIARTLVINYLASEGVTIGQIVDSGVYPSTSLFPGPTVYPVGDIEEIPAATFGYCTLAQAFDSLVSRASSGGAPFYWQIDQWKQFWFVPYTAIVNSVIVDGTSIDMKAAPPTAVVASPAYRNQQYLLGGVGQTVLQNETRKGDGNTTSWPMDFSLFSHPTITLNGVAQTVGIKGLDTNYQWYWSKGDPNIAQDTTGVKLTSSQTLAISYIGEYPTVIVSRDDSKISVQRDVEGGNTTGIVESSLTDSTISSQAEGIAYANNLVQQNGVKGSTLTFATRDPGFQQGQLATVDLPWLNYNNAPMLIESVTAADSIDSHNLWYTVNAVQGPYDTTWVEFFGRLVREAEQAPLSVGIAQTVQLAVPTTITLGIAGTVTVTLTQPPFPGPAVYPSPTFYP